MNTPHKHPQSQQNRQSLLRQLDQREFTVNVFGTIVGAGVYVLIGAGAGLAGGGLWLAFVLAVVVAGAVTLNYAELASMYPRAGVEYDFLRQAIGPGLIPYLVGWVLTLNGSATVATLAIGFGQYLDQVWPSVRLLAAVLLIVLLTVAVLAGLKLDTRANLVMAAVEAGGLLVVIALGATRWSGAQVFEWPQGLGGVLNASALLFFALTGFEDSSKMSEEVMDPTRNIPVGLLTGLGLASLLYVGLSLAVVQLASAQELASSEAPLSFAVSRVWGEMGATFVAVVALFSIANTALFVLVAHSRLMFAMARGGSLPAGLTRILPQTSVPWVTTLLAGGLALIMIPLGQVEIVGSVASWSALLVYASVSASLIFLRLREPNARRPFRVPLSVGNFPILAAFAIFASLLLSVRFEWPIIALGIGVAALGVVLYPLLRQERA